MTIQQLMMGGRNIAQTPIVLFLTNTAASTWTVPSDWNDSILGPAGYANRVECIGGGGSGGDGGSDGAGGGGGGGYSLKNNVSLTPGSAVPIKVGAGGVPEEGDGQDTWFVNTGTVLAKAGLNPPGVSTANKEGGAGGQASAGVGDVKYSGGRGRDQGASSSSGGGGGGAAGPGGNAEAGGGISSVGGAAGPGSWTATNGAVAAPGAGANAGSTTGGFLYGGGGNGEGSSPAGRPGAQGIIVISYYPIIS